MRIYGVVSWTAAICVFAIALPAQAGQDANFVLYNHYMEEKGETEISIYSDYGRVGKGEPNYTAQLLEIEYGVTSLWTSSVYFEFAKTFGDGEKYDFASFRWENRYKLFKNETFLNPVLYGELEIKKPNSRFLRSVVGRTDGGEEGEGEIEHEIETKLILSHDFSSNFNVAFNTIQELKLDNGVWSFGYVGGVNYVVYRAFDSASVADLGGLFVQHLAQCNRHGRRAGVAVATIVNGQCSACNVKVPTGVVSAAHSATVPAYCTSCGRILVLAAS